MGKTKNAQSGTSADASEFGAAMLAANPFASKAWMDIMSDGARFLSERLKQDVETQMALLACKTPAELMEVQSEYFKTAMEQYSDQAQHVFKMMTEAAASTTKTAPKGLARRYDDVPL